MLRIHPGSLALLLGLAACAGTGQPNLSPPAPTPGNAVAVAFTGEPLPAIELDPAKSLELEVELGHARILFEAEEASLESTIWLGRRLAYLGRYREAVDVYTEGLGRYPESYRLLRHRGHRFLTLREPARAVEDLELARTLCRKHPDKIEQDGAPNALGIPRSSTHSNIGYHLGLAYFVQAKWERALEVYRWNLKANSINDDMLVATSYWLVLTLRKLGREQEAQAVLASIRPEMDVIENHAYHDLLLLFRGERDSEALLDAAETSELGFATLAFGIAQHYMHNGQSRAGVELLQRIQASSFWPAFGHLAAEAELSRL